MLTHLVLVDIFDNHLKDSGWHTYLVPRRSTNNYVSSIVVNVYDNTLLLCSIEIIDGCLEIYGIDSIHRKLPLANPVLLSELDTVLHYLANWSHDEL